MPLVFRALGHDINKLGISVVECGGKTKLGLFVRVARALEIPHVVMVDDDVREIDPGWSEARKKSEQDRNKKHEQGNAELTKVVDADRLFLLKPNFEAEVGLSQSEDEKVDQALKRFAQAKAGDVPDCLRKPIERLLQ